MMKHETKRDKRKTGMLVYVFINTTNRKFYGYNLFLMKAEWNYLQEMRVRMRMRMNDATAIYSRIV